MQAPSASDPSFKAFLEKLQEQNNRGFVSQLVQLKAERENAGEDNDKREEQLNDVISSLKEVRLAVTGNKLDIDLTPLINIGENQTKLLEELSKEASLTRKLTEGSVEYDKEAAQYRNTSGRDIESKVSGKTSKDGGFLDFETARDTLSGQGKRAKEANAFDLKPINYTPGKAVAAAVGGKGKKPADEEEAVDQPAFKGFLEEIKSGFKFFMTDGLSEKPGTGFFQTPSKEVEKKEEKDREAKVSSPRQENPEADNVASTDEIQADASKSDLELSKQMLDTTKAQLVELKAIREALAPKTPKDLVEQKSAPSSTNEKESGGGGGGSILGDLASGAIDLLGSGGNKAPGKAPGKVPGKVAGKAAGIGGKILGGMKALGSKAVGFANSGAGKLLGSVAAVGLGAYTAYEGFTAAEDSKQAKMEEVQAKVDSGEMKPEEAAAARKEIGNTATVEKSGAIGEGTGMAAGAIAGAKLGAIAGTFIGGPVGTAIGGLAGGAIGAFAGSKAGKVVGEYGGKAINAAGEGIDYVKEKAGKLGSSVSGFFGGIGDKVKGAFTGSKAGKVVGEKVGSGMNAVKGFFGGSTDAPGVATKEALAAAPATVKDDLESLQARRDKLAKQGPATDSPQSIKAHETLLGTLDKAIEDKKSKPREEKVTGGPGAKNPARPQRTEAGVAAFDKAYSEARSDGKSVQESKEIGNKARNTVDAAATPVVEQKSVDTAAPAGAATKEALAPTPAIVKNQAQATVKSETTESKTSADIQVSDSEFRKKDPENFKKFVDFRDKRRDEIAKDLAKTYGSDKPSIEDMEEATVEAKLEANIKFKKEIEAVSAGKVETKTETTKKEQPVVEKKTISGTAARTIPEEKGILSKAADTAKSIGSSIAGFFGFGDKKKPVDTAAPGKAVVASKETVDGKPASVQPSGGDKFRDALSTAVGSAKQMVSNGEVDPKHLDEAVDQVMANVEGVSPQSANIIEKAVRAELQKGAKNPVIASTAASEVSASPVVEKKPVDTTAPGAVAAVAMGAAISDTAPAVQPAETVSGGLVARSAAALTPKDSVTSPTSVITLTKGNNGTMNLPDGTEIPATLFPEGDLQPRMPPGSQKLNASVNGQQVEALVYGGRAYVRNYKAPEASVEPPPGPAPADVQPAETISGTPPVKSTTADDQGTGYKPKYDWKVGHHGGNNLVAPSPPTSTGKEVTKTSTENADMGREAGKGGANNTVVSNNVSSNNTTKFVPMKANPRPEYTGSSLDRYTNRITVY